MMLAPKIPAFAQRLSDQRYFTATIEVLRDVKEKDADGDIRTIKNHVVAEIPGRIVRGKDPLETTQAERVVTVKNWEIRLSLRRLEELKREKGCFELKTSDTLRDKKSKWKYQNQGDDIGRTEENYLSVFCVQVG